MEEEAGKFTMLYDGFMFIIQQESRLCRTVYGAIQGLQDSDCGVGLSGFGKYFPCLLLACVPLLLMCRLVNFFSLGELTGGRWHSSIFYC